MEKQQIGGVSFPGCAPNVVHGLVPKGSTVKTDTMTDGLSDASLDRRPCLQRDFAQEKTWPRLKGELASSQTELGCPECGIGFGFGFFCFIFCVCLCLGLNLFIPQVITHPIRSSSCRKLLVLSCLIGICLGLGGGFPFPFLLFGSPSVPGRL